MSTDTDTAALKETLTGYCTHVPPRVNSGSYNLSVEFKQKVSAARKTLTKRGVKLFELQSAINTLHRFWEPA